MDWTAMAQVLGAALGTLAAVGTVLAGATVAYRKLSTPKNGGSFGKAAEHQFRENMLTYLREIRDGVRDHNRDAEHRHDVVMMRLSNIEKEATRP